MAAEDRLDRRSSMAVLRRLGRGLRPYRSAVLRAAVWTVVSTIAALSGPILVRFAIDHGLNDRNVRALNLAVAGYGLAFLAQLASSRNLTLAVSYAGEGYLRDLRVRVFDHLQTMSMAFFDRSKAGVLVSRMTSDIDSIGELVQFGVQQLVSNLLLLVATAVLLVTLSPLLSVLCLVAVPLVVVASIWFQRESNEAYLVVRDRIGNTLSALQEGIIGVRVVQAFGREDRQIEAFEASSDQLYDAHMRTVKLSALYFPVVELAGTLTTATVVGVGGWLVHRGSVSIGTVVAFVLLLANLFEPIQQLSQLFNTVQSAGASLNKLYTLLDTPPDVAEPARPLPLEPDGSITFEGVSFGYEPGRLVLEDVDLSIAPGERIALVGPTGAGKSTLAKLAARLYDPTAGTVRFGGTDLRAASTADLRSKVVVIPQEGFLFSGTIEQNVAIARSGATRAEVEAALAAIGALERFASLPDGLDTQVDERGARLSAGEKQLVSLARAALVDPAVLVLDEATSSLDPGTEQAVEAALEQLSQGRTVIAIAHRLTTAERADRVGVVDGGRLVELGPHTELVTSGGAYARLHAAWKGSGTVTA